MYKKDSTLVSKQRTNEDGIIVFRNLYQGDYILKEENVDDNYIKKNEEFNISVTYNKQVVKEITNKYKKGNLKITKVDKEDNNVRIDGVEFDLIDENQNVVKHIKTDEKRRSIY